MTEETLTKANTLHNTIERLKRDRKYVADGKCFYKETKLLDTEVLSAGKSAMLAVIDEAIENAAKELESL
ncbi:MAG: hypothetical protein KGL39_03055 [Patescibacteria group bacterium]|nr:hypothetical protein [Patescibacteria group bacterium]